jgi:hypothetical protein
MHCIGRERERERERETKNQSENKSESENESERMRMIMREIPKKSVMLKRATDRNEINVEFGFWIDTGT